MKSILGIFWIVESEVILSHVLIYINSLMLRFGVLFKSPYMLLVIDITKCKLYAVFLRSNLSVVRFVYQQY